MSLDDDTFNEQVAAFERLWPVANTDLLAQGDDWWQNACLTYQDGQWVGYVEGYRKATRLIADHVSNTSQDQDYLVWPFVLCWRHHIELQLKNLILILREYLDEPSPQGIRTHSIAKLWIEFKSLIAKAEFDEPHELENVNHVLVQLHALDPSSESFRYPIRNSGESSLPPGVTHLHFRRFQEAMEGVANYLDATDTGLQQELDMKMSMRPSLETMGGNCPECEPCR
jgi:hypothetical protein